MCKFTKKDYAKKNYAKNKKKWLFHFMTLSFFQTENMFVMMVSDLDLAVAFSPPNKALSPNSPKKSPDSGTCHR